MRIIINPFSLLKAFLQSKLASYWFESGTPSFLIRQLQYFRTDITAMDCLDVFSSDFDQPTENMKNALPLLYQSGYLTIKGYDPESEMYRLAIPNQEVRIGYVEGLLPVYTGIESRDVKAGFALKFWRALNRAILTWRCVRCRPTWQGFRMLRASSRSWQRLPPLRDSMNILCT